METISDGSEKFLDPDKIIAQLDVVPGSIAADFGCGPGYFSIPFAKKIDVTGKLFALDVLPQALESVESKRKTAGLANVAIMRVNLEKDGGSKLDSNSLDWVIIKDMLFQNQKKDVIVKEAWRVLKNGGKVIVVEWGENNLTIGPERELRISLEDLKKLFLDQKFEIEKEIDAGEYHHAFVAVKK